MNKCFFIIWTLLICYNLTISASVNAETTIDAPKIGATGQKTQIAIKTDAPLPASSFYRVEIECPKKPAGAVVSGETGYPVSEMIFSLAGEYHCIADFGVLTKSSCAGVQYRPVKKFEFTINIASN